MKIPEPFFALINPAMRLLLTSPFHGLLSSSVLLIRFRGRKTGRQFTTPVRYIRDDDGSIHLFTGQANQWWRNMRGGAPVVLVIAGRSVPCTMTVIEQPDRVATALARLLARFPQDAPYYEIESRKGQPISDAQIRVAAARTVLVTTTQPA